MKDKAIGEEINEGEMLGQGWGGEEREDSLNTTPEVTIDKAECMDSCTSKSRIPAQQRTLGTKLTDR